MKAGLSHQVKQSRGFKETVCLPVLGPVTIKDQNFPSQMLIGTTFWDLKREASVFDVNAAVIKYSTAPVLAGQGAAGKDKVKLGQSSIFRQLFYGEPLHCLEAKTASISSAPGFPTSQSHCSASR